MSNTVNKDIVDRSKILGRENVEFDKVLRGYDPKQVDEYIENLIRIQKNASTVFDQRFDELKNANSMLRYELDKATEKLDNADIKYNHLEEERQKLLKKLQEPVKQVKVVDNTALEELQAKYDSLFAKNRLMADENRKLAKENDELKRDVAHLTKKVDKNRNEIKNLRTDVESGISPEVDKRYLEISQIYENAIDKCEDLIFRLQTELSLAHSKAEDISAR
ncbi:MAG: DivIVA domain-containing protein [Eubacterium sp.]